MAQMKKYAVLVVLLAVPALMFAQAEQPSAGGMTLRLTEGIDIALRSEAGDIQAAPKDAVITTQGDIPFVVMAFSAPAEAGQDLYLVPSDRIQASADGTRAVLNLAAADIQGLQKLGDVQERPVDHYLASEAQGIAVVDASGQALGTIQDAVLDLETRKIASLVIESGGELGLGAGLYAVPADRVSGVDAAQGRVTVNMNVEELRASTVE